MYVDVLEITIGCDQLINLYCADLQYFGNALILFDGDVKENQLSKISKAIRDSLRNIVLLPGNKSPEKILYDYLLTLGPDHAFWFSGAQRVGFTWDYFNEHGPVSDDYKQEKDREKYKKWFIDHKSLFESTKLMDFWKKDNSQLVKQFREDFCTAHNHIAKRTLAMPIEDEINKAGSLEKQMEIFEAIEARYNMDHAAAGISDWELRDMKKYFTNLKKLLSIKLKKDDKAKKTASAEADDKLKAENEALKSENKVLQAHVAKIDAQLTQLDTAVKEEKEKSKAMKTEMEKTVQEYQDLVNSIDAQKEEDGERTRRVTSEALVKLIRKVTPGVKQSTFIDEAKLISYFTNYSVNRIRTDISSSQTFSKKQAAEIDAVNELFANINIDIKLKYR